MANLNVYITNVSVPAPSLAADPEITVRRADTGSVTVNSQAMTDIGEGHYSYTYAPGDTNPYAFFVDADPTASGQVTAGERYYSGSFDEVLEDIQTTVGSTNTTVTTTNSDVSGDLLALSNEITRKINKLQVSTLGNIRRR